MTRRVFFGAIVTFMALFAVSALASIDCNIRTACLGNETDFGGMNQGNDAHYENSSSSMYKDRICCGSPEITITTACSGDEDNIVFIRSFQESDSHVEQNNESAGGYEDICMGATADPGMADLSVTYENVNGSCSGRQECMFTISQGTDAHVGNCSAGAYQRTVCLLATVPALNATGSVGTTEFTATNVTVSNATSFAIGSLTTAEQGNRPSNVAFPNGFYNFTITDVEVGGSVTLTLNMPNAVLAGTRWYKPSGSGAWESFAVGSDDGDSTITISITDGGSFDADGTANGQITDPGGPGYGSMGTVPEFSAWILIFVAIGVVLAGVTRLRKRK